MAGLLVAAPAVYASVPQEKSAASPDQGSPQTARKANLVDARDLLTKARTAHRAGEFERGIVHLDEAIAVLNEIIITNKSSTVRRAAGQVFRACASLRLACSLKIYALNAHNFLIGPPESNIGERLESAPMGPTLEIPEDLPLYQAVSPDEEIDEEIDEDLEADDDEEIDILDEERPLTIVHEASMAWIQLTGGDNAFARDFEFETEPLIDDPANTLDGVELVHNTRVQKWIDYYNGRGRKHMQLYRDRAAHYAAWMEDILIEEGLPPEIVNLVYVESGFNNNAVSRSRAVGQWQFIYGTGKMFGLRINSWVDDRRNPEKATRAAARYLKHLYSLFGDWQLALASYNCGEGRTIRTMAKQGTNDYWKLRLPRETRNYIPKFMAVLAISRNPGLYGFEPLQYEPLQYDTVQLPGPVDLKAVAKECGLTLDSLRALNPSFRRFAAPPDRSGVVKLRVPEGSGETLIAGLAAGDVDLPRMVMPKEPSFRRHRVRKGEPLIGIARRYRVRTKELARVNSIRNVHRLRVGQVLRIPERNAIRYASAIESPANTSAAGSEGTAKVYSGTKTIKIRRGDTLIGLAKKYDTDVRTLRALNGLRPRQSIIAGGRLKVPIQ
jgi:membrane-bound lytic murein transglycosylase D